MRYVAATHTLAQRHVKLTAVNDIRDYLSKLGKKGGAARARKLTDQQRSDSARKAAQARWSKKMDSLIEDITQGTKALLRTAKRHERAAASAKNQKKQKP